MITSRLTQHLTATGFLTLFVRGVSLRSRVLRVTGCCLLLCVIAQVKIPVPGTEIPMTLQAPAVLAIGFTLAPCEAVAATLLYLVLGAAGLPIFAGSGGLTGATAGFLFGFVGAAWLVSVLKGGSQVGVVRIIIAGFAGFLLIFVSGVSWMTLRYGGHLWPALNTGLIPFWIKALIELAFVVTGVVSVRGAWALVHARMAEKSSE